VKGFVDQVVFDGHSRLLAAQAGGMDRQTLRDWVHRYNADGLAGLADRPRPGRQPRLAEAQRSEVAKWVEDGPDLKTDGVVRWRCADLRDRIATKFNVHLHERSVGKLLKKLNFSSISGRPVHPQIDLEAQEALNRSAPEARENADRYGNLPPRSSREGRRKKLDSGKYAHSLPWPGSPGSAAILLSCARQRPSTRKYDHVERVVAHD
jgi:transposase